MAKKKAFCLGVDELTVMSAMDIVDRKQVVTLDKTAQQKITQGVASVQKIIERGDIVYSINTGFGPLCRTKISASDSNKLQENILRSHSVGVGEPISKDLSKLMMILKLHSLCYGHSGVSRQLVDRILWHIEQDVISVVPSQGSVGASGDLAPLAHLFLPLIGHGLIWQDGKPVAAEKVLSKHKTKPLVLGPKEGLALINGTQFIAAHAVHVARRLHNCLEAADVIAALSLEAMLGSAQPFKEKLHLLRPFAGAKHVAWRMSQLLQGSELVQSHADCERVQDPYSLRCVPQVHGASRDAWSHLMGQLNIELNAVTDNPIVFADGETISGGNFHGQPMALPLDYVTLAASELGSISERRTYLMLEGKDGLPLLLMKDTGINSGFMIPQYTAAALASENKSLCFPASADSIPTSVGQEDHVSMGSISGRKALRVVENLEKILGIELLCAAQAFDFRRPLKSSAILESCHDLVREHIPHADDDRLFGQDIAVAIDLVVSGNLVATANAAAKDLGVELDQGVVSGFALN